MGFPLAGYVIGVYLMVARRIEILCLRCKTSMEYVSEVERGSEVRISRFYRCPLCGFRILDERVTIKRSEDGLVLEVSMPTNRKLIAVRVP